jgi:hypothetical protein
MSKILSFAALVALVGALFQAAPALAQNTTKVVSACGVSSFTAGTAQYPTQDTTGRACGSDTVTPAASTTGGASNYTFEVAASDNHQTIKNGAGTVYDIDAFSIHTAAMFMRLYDLGTGFNGCNSATGLIWEGQIPGPGTTGGGYTKSIPVGRAFTTGLSVCVTGGFGNTNTTSATASVSSVNIGYK